MQATLFYPASENGLFTDGHSTGKDKRHLESHDSTQGLISAYSYPIVF